MKRPKWPIVRLGTIAEFRNGLNYNKGNFGAGLKVVNVKDFQDRLIADFTGLDEINPDGLVRDECFIRDGDILFVRSNGNRELIGRSMLVTGVREQISHSAFSIKARFTTPDVLPRFYAYLFRTSLIRSELSNRGGGTNISNLNQDILDSLEVPKPPLPTQRKIAGALSAYDDLIENNTRRIAILEGMAQAIYREWFVNFRFPGHEKVKLINSPLGMIPEEWNVVRLDSLQAQERYAINGGPFGSKLGTKDYVPEGVPVIRGANLSEGGGFHDEGFVFVSPEKADDLRANAARPGDIVVTQRGTLGQIGRIPHTSRHLAYIISQSQMKVTLCDNKATSGYVYYFLRSEDSTTRIKNLASSSGVPHINLNTLREFEIVLPPHSLQVQFSAFVESLESAINVYVRHNRNLRTTRDLLLPKLISGQLDVEELDIETGEPLVEAEA